MKILVIGDPHGYNKYPKSILKKADLILITGDLGKADLARKRFFENIERKRKGLPEKEYTPKQEREVYLEVYNSTINLLKNLSRYAPVYSILGNVGTATDSETKKGEEKLGVKLPYMRKGMRKIKNFNLVRNVKRNISGLKIGFLEYFLDTNWVQEFKPSDYKEKLKSAKEETGKAKKILKRFENLDILICHQPPYKILDKVSNPSAPKHWKGKNAGSKAVLEYIKKKQPKYVFCGHIHEGKGMKKIGKTKVYNVGFNGDYLLIDTK